MSQDVADAEVAAVRAFNRFYTRKLGVLEPKLLDSPFTLQEARILYEIRHRPACTATDLTRALGLDPGFVSRTLQALQRRQIVARNPARHDARINELALTPAGRTAQSALERRSQAEVAGMLASLDEGQRAAVVGAMATIERTLEPSTPKPAAFLLRSHRPGDIGWVISSQAQAYAEEYGWDISYEALVAEICAQFIRNFDPAREHCWIAEAAGERLGSIFLVKASDDVAKLRLLLVEKKARGLGVGRALVEQCMRAARDKGYKEMTLWTQSILVAARGIYQSAGFRCVKQEPHHSFGVDLVGETWECRL